MKSRPLSPNDLITFIESIWCQMRPKQRKVLRIGICVSGGPDSMALAYLLRQLQRSKTYNIELSGLIVDHRARLGSTAEAQTVQANLSKIGIESTILTMSWPRNVDPLHLSNFESQARTKRYALLAHAAVQNNIQHLCLGHHQDDQIETILMRLIRNLKSPLRGMAGMAISSSVPSAFEVFGVHVEQDSVAVVPDKFLYSPDSSQSFIRSTVSQSKTLQVAVPGGIRLQRPLLAFRKADLIETCKFYDISYVVDPTNKDPRSTLRNAIRHMRAHYKLPEALHGQRILRLQRKSQDHIRHINTAGKAVLSTCELVLLDLRSGVAEINIPYASCKDSIQVKGYAYTISKLAEIVTPSVRVDGSTQVATHILSNFCRALHRGEPPIDWPPPSFTFGGVLFTPDSTCPQRWRLSRQPMKTLEIKQNTKRFLSDAEEGHATIQASKWLLWDNRYWIRVYTRGIDTMKGLEIRPLQESDISALNHGTEDNCYNHRSQRAEIVKSIQEAAPGKIRFTLPVLTLNGRVVALPTLQYNNWNACLETDPNILSWEVRYNAFSLVNRSSEDSLLHPHEQGMQQGMFRLPLQ